jgi:predicted S18 family serine protease
MSRLRSFVPYVAAVLLGATLMTACAEPPTREISQAQGALDAARAAGAEVYARTEFQAADAALKKAHEAVTERDYRQALSFALDAREQARIAAREASTARARAATDVALAIQSAASGVETARTRLAGPTGTREQRARIGPGLDELTAQLQEARSAVAAGDYARAAERTKAIQDRLAAFTAELLRR